MGELTGDDIKAILEIHQQWLDAERAGNSAGVIDLCTDDVTWLVPGSVPLVGKSAIAAWLQKNEANLVELEVDRPEIRGSETTAYLMSEFRSRFEPTGGTPLRELTGMHLWVLQKMAPAGWQVVVVSWSSWQNFS